MVPVVCNSVHQAGEISSAASHSSPAARMFFEDIRTTILDEKLAAGRHGRFSLGIKV